VKRFNDQEVVIVSPTIRVDDEVFALLQSHATAFVDSPNDVLRRLFSLGEPGRPKREDDDTPDPDRSGFRMRRDANGFGDDDRYLRGMQATIYRGDEVVSRSGTRSPRGADLNQIQTWIADLVGLRNPANATLIHNLRIGSLRERIGEIMVVVEPQSRMNDE
jgi:hypothetical protein